MTRLAPKKAMRMPPASRMAGDAASSRLLREAMERLELSARAYDRILKVARTIADLAGRPKIEHSQIAEAIRYRSLDRSNWGAH